MLKYAVIGISHPHTASLHGSLAKYPDEAVCIGYADTPPHDAQNVDVKIGANLGKASEALTRFDDYRRLIGLKPDLAIVCCDNADCADIAIECANAGISVALEKPMTIDYASARRLADRANSSGVKLAVNWPIAWFPSFNKAYELCRSGRIGRIMRVVYRSPATWGPYSYSKDGQNPPFEKLAETWWYRKARGGGSLLDYACYGTALATWFFGKPALGAKAITKSFCLGAPESGIDVEDYSAVILDFGDGVGLLEGSWSTFNCGEIPSGPVIYGDEGTIVCDRHSNLCKLYIGRSHGPVAPTEVFDCGNASPDANFGRCIIDHITKGAPLHPLLEPELNVAVMRALSAAAENASNS